MDVQKDAVLWWTGLLDVPEDVLKLLEWLIGKFGDDKDAVQEVASSSGGVGSLWSFAKIEHAQKKVEQVFVKIDGPGGNGAISWIELQEWLEKEECRKFMKEDDEECIDKGRVEKIFRFLDPGGEGTVSNEEWQILAQLWNEVDLCITEFANFLVESYGDLEAAWDQVDLFLQTRSSAYREKLRELSRNLYVDAESRSLNEEEWVEAAAGIGYFGPASCIFGILDYSGDGDIQVEEFLKLQHYVR